MSEKIRRWLIAGVMVLGIVPFVWTSIAPMLSSGDTGQTAAVETTTPTPTQTAQVSPEARQEELKQRLLGAARGYETILQTEPENQTALLALFETRKELVQLGAVDIKQAIEPLEKLIRLNPNDIALQLELGRSYAQQQRFDDAIAILEKLVRLNPNDIAYQLELGSLYVQQQRSAEAIAIYDNAAKIDQKDYRPILAKGIVLQLEGKKDEAKPLFNRATELAPAAFKQQVQAQIQQIETLTSLPKTPPAPSSDRNAPAPPVSPAKETAPKSDAQTQPVSPAPAATPESNLTNPTPGDNITQPAVPAPAATPSP